MTPLGSWGSSISLLAPTRHRYALLLGDVPIASSSSRDELQAYLLVAFHCSPVRGELLGKLCGCDPHMHPAVVETREAQHGSA